MKATDWFGYMALNIVFIKLTKKLYSIVKNIALKLVLFLKE